MLIISTPVMLCHEILNYTTSNYPTGRLSFMVRYRITYKDSYRIMASPLPFNHRSVHSNTTVLNIKISFMLILVLYHLYLHTL